jgi:hypothetical protein
MMFTISVRPIGIIAAPVKSICSSKIATIIALFKIILSAYKTYGRVGVLELIENEHGYHYVTITRDGAQVPVFELTVDFTPVSPDLSDALSS